MAVPKKRTSKQKQRQRRTHDSASVPNVVSCPNCNEPILSHHVCPSCGHYKGREVLATED